MRSSLRLLAKVKPSSQYLEANTPTGLTGIQTHPSPRPSLIVLYNQTLSKLSSLPENSVYRKSTEALTRHRLKIVSSAKPAGYEEWLEKTKAVVDKEPEAYKHLKQPDGSYAPRLVLGDSKIEWDGEKKQRMTEGPQSVEELQKKAQLLEDAGEEHTVTRKSLEVEPPLDAEQYALSSSPFPIPNPKTPLQKPKIYTNVPKQNIRNRDQDRRRPNRRSNHGRRRRIETRQRNGKIETVSLARLSSTQFDLFFSFPLFTIRNTRPFDQSPLKTDIAENQMGVPDRETGRRPMDVL